MTKHVVPPRGRGDNRHPADRLAEVRAEIAALQAEEDGLRRELLRAGASLVGVEHVARIDEGTQRRLDPDLLRGFLTEAEIDACRRARKVRYVRVLRIAETGRQRQPSVLD